MRFWLGMQKWGAGVGLWCAIVDSVDLRLFVFVVKTTFSQTLVLSAKKTQFNFN
jgi:hypothetical protein